ncbi:hypothetical protein BJS_06964 [Bradyrhizobium japonicum SEMIA 5079]|nr:hypothetical protein BJS_06964 [Bradyrhizobium japonicum SEMIA 5079]
MPGNLARRVAHGIMRPSEVDVTPASSDDLNAPARAKLHLKLSQQGLGIETIHIDYENAGRRAGCDGNVVVGLLSPPF